MLRRRFTVHLITPASPALVSDEKVADAGIERGRVELGMADQHLDHADVSPGAVHGFGSNRMDLTMRSLTGPARSTLTAQSPCISSLIWAR
jgi:hypothetical protein